MSTKDIEEKLDLNLLERRRLTRELRDIKLAEREAKKAAAVAPAAAPAAAAARVSVKK